LVRSICVQNWGKLSATGSNTSDIGSKEAEIFRIFINVFFGFFIVICLVGAFVAFPDFNFVASFAFNLTVLVTGFPTASSLSYSFSYPSS